MDAFEAILTRRSIRKYESLPIEPAKVDMMLRSAMAAPSAGNQQPWRFIVVRDTEVLAQLAETSPYAKMLPGAAAAIVVCADTGDLRHAGNWQQDCAAATENILLAAHGLGLGAVWLGFTPIEERMSAAAKVLGITDEHVVVFSIVSLGYPAETRERSERYREDFVHLDRW